MKTDWQSPAKAFGQDERHNVPFPKGIYMKIRTLSLVVVSMIASGSAQQGMPNMDSMIVIANCYDYAKTTAALADAYVVLLKIAHREEAAEHLSAVSKAYEADLAGANPLLVAYQPTQKSTDLILEGDRDLRKTMLILKQKLLNPSQKRSVQRIAKNVYIAILKDEHVFRILDSLQGQHRLQAGTPAGTAALSLLARGPQQFASANTLGFAIVSLMEWNDMSTDALRDLTATDGMQWGTQCYFEAGKPEPCDGDLSD